MIVIADIHFGRENDSIMTKDGPSQSIDIMTRLEYVIHETKKRGLTAVAVAGDIFNKVNPSTRHISMFFEWLAKCRDEGIQVYLIGGNHDAGVDWMNMVMIENANLGNVVVFTAPNAVEIDDGRSSGQVLFWPHLTLAHRELIEQSGKSVSEYVATQFPDAEMIITHGQVDQSDYVNDIFFEAGDAMIIDSKPFKKVKTIVSGHIHNSGIYGPVVYPGSLTINNFGEVSESKGFIDLDLGKKKMTWFPFPEDDVTPWRHVELDLTDKDETALDEAQIKELAEGAVLKITVLAKRHGVINESAIRELFNKYGKITRFETKVEGVIEETVTKVRKPHTVLLKEYLEEQTELPDKVRVRALALGKAIIGGCVNDQ